MILQILDDSGIVFADHGQGDVTLRDDLVALEQAANLIGRTEAYVKQWISQKSCSVSRECETGQ